MGMAAASADASSMIYIGMSMVKKHLDEFLAGNGVSAVEPVVGIMFDHATEEALQREPSDQPEGTVPVSYTHLWSDKYRSGRSRIRPYSRSRLLSGGTFPQRSRPNPSGR